VVDGIESLTGCNKKPQVIHLVFGLLSNVKVIEDITIELTYWSIALKIPSVGMLIRVELGINSCCEFSSKAFFKYLALVNQDADGSVVGSYHELLRTLKAKK